MTNPIDGHVPLDAEHVIGFGKEQGELLYRTANERPPLRMFMRKEFSGMTEKEKVAAYAAWLTMSGMYVTCTVPMLEAAGSALEKSDDPVDRHWSGLFYRFAESEKDATGKGHHLWAQDDITALLSRHGVHDAKAATKRLMELPHPLGVRLYGTYFVDLVARHPYAPNGAKFVLEWYSITTAPELLDGLRESGMDGIDDAVSLIYTHGILDKEHSREGHDMLRAKTPGKSALQDIVYGACVTASLYPAMLDDAVRLQAEVLKLLP